MSLTKQGYGNHQYAKTQYETFLSKNGTSVASQKYLRQAIQSLMTLSKCTSYIGNQMLTGTYTDEYNKEYLIKIKINVLPYMFNQNTSTKEYTIAKYYGTNESVAVSLTYRGEKITNINSFAFSNCSSLSIYCETEFKPSGWSSS